MPKLVRTRRLLCLLATIALVAAACGGDDDTPVDSTLEATPTPTTEAGEAASGSSDEIDPVAEPGDTPTDGEPSVDDTVDETEDVEEEAPEEDPAAVIPGGGEALPAPTQAPISGDPAFTAASKLSTVGLDEIFFGDTVEDAAEKASTEWVGLPDDGARPQCFTVQPAGGPTGVLFTVLDGRIERIDIANPIITTRSGAGVGTTQAQLFDLFGDRLEETEFDKGSDIMFVPADADDREFRIIWTTDGLAATRMRAGRMPGILTDSPCG